MSHIIPTTLKSWVEVPTGSDFPIQNLPYCIFKTRTLNPRAGVAIGNHIVHLSALSHLGYLQGLSIDSESFRKDNLNDFIALGKPAWQRLRARLAEVLAEGNEKAKKESASFLIPLDRAELLLPIKIGDYTDFYSSEEHATNVGIMFRGKDNALMPNWKHLPVGYHGRASSIVVSGTNFLRPKGQMKPADAERPIFGVSKKMDFELEMAFVVGKSTKLGETVPVETAEDHIFGMMLFNDWSARDIQQWEYVPLGPFLGKNFASSVSPFIVTLDALEYFRTKSPEQNPEPLPYLQSSGEHTFDIQLEVSIQPENSSETVISRSNFKYLYWNICQQLAHHTVNGCNIKVGDLMASGTISGKDENSFGSLLELTWNGQKPLKMNDGSQRIFLEDNDSVIMRGFCQKEGIKIGFGEVKGKILPNT
jgi:fumarylacetoacetase